jgi:NADPH-dependent 2,4-dienoyl-CoA reductase/sulfur reductase-like enzyme
MKEFTNIAIIGASAAGLSSALTIKRNNPDLSVTLFRKVDKTPVPCGIPYIYGTLKDVNKDIIPDSHFTSLGINFKIADVSNIDIAKKTIFYNGGDSLGYEQLLIATGSIPFVPPIEGVELKNVYAIDKNPKNLEAIEKKLKNATNIVIIGGGFIGVEMAEQIAKLKGDKAVITVIEMLPHCLMAAIEEEFCIEAENELRRLGVNILTKSQVTKLKGDGKVEKVILANNDWIKADVVIIGVGAAPNVGLAEKCGIPYDKRGGILVNKHMQTGIDNVYAAGDCAQKFSFVTGKPSGIRLASVAAYEGIIAGNNILGNKLTNKGAVGAFSTKIGNIALASAGLTRNACEKENIEYVTGEFEGPDKHPATLPNTFKNMKAILIFGKEDGKIVGGHIKGGDSTGEMINIVATAIQSGLTAEELYGMQVATHPLLTGSPIAHHINRAAGDAFFKMK